MTPPAAEDLLSVPISALEHWEYCPRQAALIHVESYFDSNVDTVRGDLAHAVVDRPGTTQSRDRVRLIRSLPVFSDALGLHGVCDAVQLDQLGPVPIEHKSGSYRAGGPADVQVAAQVLCLREMFGVPVPVGLVFCGRQRRRYEVVVDDALTARVRHATRLMRTLLCDGRVPPPVNDSRCRRCSLEPGCMPGAPIVAGDLFRPRPLGDWDD